MDFGFDYFDTVMDIYEDEFDKDGDKKKVEKFMNGEISFYEQLFRSNNKRYAYFLANIYDYYYTEADTEMQEYTYASLAEKYTNVILDNPDYFASYEISFFQTTLKDLSVFFHEYYSKAQQYDLANMYLQKSYQLTAKEINNVKKTLLVKRSTRSFSDSLKAEILVRNMQYLNKKYLSEKHADSIIDSYNSLLEICNVGNANFTDSYRKKIIANTHYALSYYYLFTGNYQKSLSSVDQCLRIDPSKERVLTNKALALLLNNQFDDAMLIYAKYKHIDSWKKAFLGDIKALEDYGIVHNDLKKVKDFLNN